LFSKWLGENGKGESLFLHLVLGPLVKITGEHSRTFMRQPWFFPGMNNLAAMIVRATYAH
jgi:hypothetical protein